MSNSLGALLDSQSTGVLPRGPCRSLLLVDNSQPLVAPQAHWPSCLASSRGGVEAGQVPLNPHLWLKSRSSTSSGGAAASSFPKPSRTGIPAAGKRVEISGIDISRISDGKVMEMVGWINNFPMSLATGNISDWTYLPSHERVRMAYQTHVVRSV